MPKGSGDSTLYLIDRLIGKRNYSHWKFGVITQYKVSLRLSTSSHAKVHRITLPRNQFGGLSLQVKWVGYSLAESTWEPEWQLPDDVIAQYEAQKAPSLTGLSMRVVRSVSLLLSAPNAE
jgi:hypothetical protein